MVEKTNIGRVLLFPGCIYGNDLAHLIPKYVSLLNAAGIDVTVFEDKMCCGYVFRCLGRKGDFKENGERLVSRIEAFSPNIVVNLCPTCNRHFQKHLKRDCGLSEEIEVCHICRFILDANVDNQVIYWKNRGKTVVGFQDPCWLGRRSGDYDSPRRLIRAMGYDLRDGTESKEFAGCCGYSGVVPVYHPEVAFAIGQKRLDYFDGLGVDYVVTSCPRCYLGLRSGRKATPKVLDIVEFIELDTYKT